MGKESLIKSIGIKKTFADNRKHKKEVLKGINIKIPERGLIGLLGESGAGKSTIAKIITGQIIPDEGEIIYKSKRLPSLKKRTFEQAVKIQYIFQDPYAALQSSSTVEEVLFEPVKLCRKRSYFKYILPDESCYLVGINDYDKWKDKRVDQLSGGERQRIAIARALIPRPELLISDESTSMLDSLSASEILSLLAHISKTSSLSVLFITHQLEVVQKACNYINVIHKGKIVEEGSTEKILYNPENLYTRNLIKSMKIFSK